MSTLESTESGHLINEDRKEGIVSNNDTIKTIYGEALNLSTLVIYLTILKSLLEKGTKPYSYSWYILMMTVSLGIFNHVLFAIVGLIMAIRRKPIRWVSYFLIVSAILSILFSIVIMVFLP